MINVLTKLNMVMEKLTESRKLDIVYPAAVKVTPITGETNTVKWKQIRETVWVV